MNPKECARVVRQKSISKLILKELGLKKSDIVGVHNALSSFGYVVRAQDK